MGMGEGKQTIERETLLHALSTYYEEQNDPEYKVSQRARQHHNVVFVLSYYLYKLTFNFRLADPFVHDARNSHFEFLFLSL